MDQAGLTPAYATEARQRTEASAVEVQQREEAVARRAHTARSMVVNVLDVAEVTAGLALV
jgi:hypothetical protein